MRYKRSVFLSPLLCMHQKYLIFTAHQITSLQFICLQEGNIVVSSVGSVLGVMKVKYANYKMKMSRSLAPTHDTQTTNNQPLIRLSDPLRPWLSKFRPGSLLFNAHNIPESWREIRNASCKLFYLLYPLPVWSVVATINFATSVFIRCPKLYLVRLYVCWLLLYSSFSSCLLTNRNSPGSGPIMVIIIRRLPDIINTRLGRHGRVCHVVMILLHVMLLCCCCSAVPQHTH